MYRNARSFYQTSRPGLIIAFIFCLIFAFGFFKAAFPERFYGEATGRIDTAITDVAYYQNAHKLELKMQEGVAWNQSYPSWWYAIRPKSTDLKKGTAITLYVDSNTNQFYGIRSAEKLIQPASFDIFYAYFNSTVVLFFVFVCLASLAIYHYREIIKNPFLWMPYATGILIISFFTGYLNPIIFLMLAAVATKFILKKRRETSQSTY